MKARAWIVSASLLVACREVPTSVLLEIQAAPGVALDEIRLSVFEPGGAAVKDRRLPEQGPAKVPSSVVLFPRSADGTLRLLARATLAGTLTAEDATSITIVRATQVRAALYLKPGALPDADGDGVPDLIDNCPSLANPAQGPCSPGGDGRLDAGPDLPRADGLPDAPPLDRALLDRPNYEQTALRDGPAKPDLPRPLDGPLPKPDLPKPDLPKPDLPKPDLPRFDLPKPDLPPKPPDGGCPPLAGSYTLGSSGASFPSFAVAIAQLVKCGVSAAVTITVAGGSYQEAGFSFPSIPGSSTNARITFRAAPGSAVKLIGVTAAAGTSYTGIIKIGANAAHLVLEGFDLDGALSQNVIPGSYSGPVVFDSLGGQEDITLRRLDIHDFGPTAWSSYTYIGGIYIQQSATVRDLTIEGCSFRNLNPSASFHTQGAISTRNGALPGLRIIGNRFVGIQKMDCLNLRGGTFENLLIANNFFTLDAGAAGSGALEFFNGGTLVGTNNRIVFNTIYAPATGISYAISGSLTGALSLQNNILQASSTSTAFVASTGATIQGGHNCIYSASPGSGYTLVATDLTVNPALQSSTDLHLLSISPLLGKGNPISGVTTDIDGDTRGSPPEIGADELP